MSLKKISIRILISVFIMLGLVVASVIYVHYSDNKAQASNEIWQHFKTISLVMVSHFFGSKYTSPS